MLQDQPEAAGMMEKQNREQNRKWNPDRKLSVDVESGICVKEKKTGNGDKNGGSIIDINRADEIALLPLEFQAAYRAGVVHPECFFIQRSPPAAGTLEARSIAEHSN